MPDQYSEWGATSALLQIGGENVWVCIWCHKPCVDHKEPHKEPRDCESWYDF